MRTAVHLRRVALGGFDPREAGRFPFDVPAIRSLSSIEFTTPVTFLVGENGSGDRVPIAPVAYEDPDHVTITRDFLNDPASCLRRL